MIMNDFDDEATMEEEEAMGEEDDEDELSGLTTNVILYCLPFLKNLSYAWMFQLTLRNSI